MTIFVWLDFMNKYLLIAVLLVSFSAGFGVQGWRMGEKLAKANLETSKTLQKISVTAATKQRELQNELDKEQARLSVVETEQYAIMRNAEDKTRRLDAAVNALNKRLLVNASCPAHSDRLPKTRTDSSMGERTRPELNPSARPTYNALRDGIVKLEAQVAYYREACRRPD